MKLGFETSGAGTIPVHIRNAELPYRARFSGTPMLQSALFANLQVNNFGIPTVRFASPMPLLRWAGASFARLRGWAGDGREQSDLRRLGAHIRRDIGLLG